MMGELGRSRLGAKEQRASQYQGKRKNGRFFFFFFLLLLKDFWKGTETDSNC